MVFMKICNHESLERNASIYYPEDDMFSEVLLPSIAVKRTRAEFRCVFCSTFHELTKRIRQNLVQERIVDKPAIAPSLFDMCIDEIAKKNVKDVAVVVEAFNHICIQSDKKYFLVNKLIASKKMNHVILGLLLKESPTEVRLNSCTWADEKRLFRMIKESNFEKLVVLQLDLCKRFSMDTLIFTALPKNPNSLPCLNHLSLRDAKLLFDKALKHLATLAPSLHTVNIGGCVSITSLGIEYLVEVLKNLRELYIDGCYRIFATELIDSVVKIQLLEVLSVKSVPSISDDFVTEFVKACGHHLKELNIAMCRDITNTSIEAIGCQCPLLSSLDISGCNITDLSLCLIANGCRPLTTFRIGACPLSDEAVSVFLEVSGRSLSELSLMSVVNVSYNTTMSLGRFTKSLKSLDLSNCIRLTDEELLFIVNGCPSLELLILFGYDKLRKKFQGSHSNRQLKVLGLDCW